MALLKKRTGQLSKTLDDDNKTIVAECCAKSLNCRHDRVMNETSQRAAQLCYNWRAFLIATNIRFMRRLILLQESGGLSREPGIQYCITRAWIVVLVKPCLYVRPDGWDPILIIVPALSEMISLLHPSSLRS